MWLVLNGTVVNVATVLAGSAAGLAVGARVPQRYQRIILDVLGLVTITLGIDAAVMVFGDTVGEFRPAGGAGQTYAARLAVVMIGSLVIGAVLGTALRLHERLEGLGESIHRRFVGPSGWSRHKRAAGDVASPGDSESPKAATKSASQGAEVVVVDLDYAPQGDMARADGARFAEGFLAASVIFCVGPLTLLGCLDNGARADPSLLYIKSILDLFCSMALAASLGAGVLGSILTIIVFQGGLSLLAWRIGDLIPKLSLQMMTVTGGVVLLATALVLLDIRKIPVANMLPAIFLPPLIIVIVELVAPGTLMMAP